MSKSIAVASGKGGTGKTSFCANVAVSLCALGENVLLIDADAGLRSLDLVLGMDAGLLMSYADVLDGTCALSDACVRHDVVKNLAVLTAPASPRVFAAEEIKGLIKLAKERFSFVIVDCPAGIDGNVTDFCASSDRAVVVATPDRVSLRTAQKMGLLLKERGQEDVKIAVNRVRPDMIKRGDALNIDESMDSAGLPLCAVIPEDKEVMACGNDGSLLIFKNKSRAARAYFNAAERMLGNNVPLLRGIGKKF